MKKPKNIKGTGSIFTRDGSSLACEKRPDDRRDGLQPLADRISIDPEGLQGRGPESVEGSLGSEDNGARQGLPESLDRHPGLSEAKVLTSPVREDDVATQCRVDPDTFETVLGSKRVQGPSVHPELVLEESTGVARVRDPHSYLEHAHGGIEAVACHEVKTLVTARGPR